MADVPPLRRNIQTEESRFRFAVSESIIQKAAGSINFINDRQVLKRDLFLNGPYSIVATPQLGVDGLIVFEFDIKIINVFIFSLVPGASGTTELDLKRATSPGGAFSSIFSTTPKVSSTAAANIWAGAGDVVAGVTAPILSTTDLDADDAVRLDLISAMSGGQNAGLIMIYRPR